MVENNGSNGRMVWMFVAMTIAGSYAFVTLGMLYLHSRIESMTSSLTERLNSQGTTIQLLDRDVQGYKLEQARAIARGDEVLKRINQELDEVRRKSR